jgi:hypothetical protein
MKIDDGRERKGIVEWFEKGFLIPNLKEISNDPAFTDWNHSINKL